MARTTACQDQHMFLQEKAHLVISLHFKMTMGYVIVVPNVKTPFLNPTLSHGDITASPLKIEGLKSECIISIFSQP